MGNSNKHIDKKIKKSFDQLDKKAPEGLWKNISKASNLNQTEFKVRESFETDNKIAPTNSWKNVKKQLIIDEVWENIVIHEDKRKRKKIWWYFSGVASLLVFFSVMLFSSESVNSTRKPTSLKNISYQKNSISKNPLNQQEINIHKTDSNDQEKSQFGTISHKQLIKNNGDNVISTSTNITVQKQSSNDNQKNNISLKTTDNLDIQQNQNVENEDLDITSRFQMNEKDSNTITTYLIEKITPIQAQQLLTTINQPQLHFVDSLPKTATQKYEIGITGALGNSWVLNTDVKNGLESKSLIHNEVSMGYDLGMVFTYNFSRSSGIEAEYDFISVNNQGYHYYNEGRYLHKHIRLKQQKITISYKQRFSASQYRKRNTLVKAGMYFSHFVKENTTIDGLDNGSNSSFSTVDYGINLALGSEYKFNRFKFEYGLKTDIGLNNITANSVTSKKFNYATNLFLGGYISFRYLF